MKCFIPGGSSAPILMPADLDVQIAVETVAAAGSMAGSGAVIVMDDRTSMVHLALRVADFYRHESCGKCTPCREGTRWMVELLKRVASGEAQLHEIDLLVEMCDRIEGKCLCPLGDACAMPVRSYLKHFREEFEACVGGVGVPDSLASPFGALYPELKRNLAVGARLMATTESTTVTVTFDGREVRCPPARPWSWRPRTRASRSRCSVTSPASARPSAPAACAWSRSRWAAGRCRSCRRPAR